MKYQTLFSGEPWTKLEDWFKLYLFDFTADIYNTCIRQIYITGFDGKH